MVDEILAKVDGLELKIMINNEIITLSHSSSWY